MLAQLAGRIYDHAPQNAGPLDDPLRTYMTTSQTFGIQFSNVPVINLRWEFREFFHHAHTPGFLRGPMGMVVGLKTAYFDWHGMPEAGATMMLGRSILGVESYVTFAAEFGAAKRRPRTAKMKEAFRNPFSLGKGAAENYYNGLPALVDPSFAMRSSDHNLWKATEAFYREVRNPIFHGKELKDITEKQFAGLYDHIASVYRWLDSWYDPEELGRGATKSFALRNHAT